MSLCASGSPVSGLLMAAEKRAGVGRPYRCQLVEAGKELIEGHDQLLRRALGRQTGEALDICKQDAAETQRHHWSVDPAASPTPPSSPPRRVPSPWTWTRRFRSDSGPPGSSDRKSDVNRKSLVRERGRGEARGRPPRVWTEVISVQISRSEPA